MRIQNITQKKQVTLIRAPDESYFDDYYQDGEDVCSVPSYFFQEMLQSRGITIPFFL